MPLMLESKPHVMVPIDDLRVGMFIHLDLSWIHHPFPLGSFRISSVEQIATLRGLGLEQVRFDPTRSAPEVQDWPSVVSAVVPKPSLILQEGTTTNETEVREPSAKERHLQHQQQILAVCNQQFSRASVQYQRLSGLVLTDPEGARLSSHSLVGELVSGLLSNGESAIRLLSEGVGERSALHPVNVMVISLLLGKALGMTETELRDLGLAALLHDIGVVELPERLRTSRIGWSPQEKEQHKLHVGYSVDLARRMGLSEVIATAIAQHHEMADGMGFPSGLRGDDFSREGRILALVNHYDRLCNPSGDVPPLTPHEALSVMFARLKPKFDAVTLGAFIRMMGVYPPGSIVELVNDRYALVVSVNSSRPLRPRVIMHDPAVPREEALILDLETLPHLGIRRSVKPSRLPRDAMQYLAPSVRTCYFFESADGGGSSDQSVL